MVKQRTTIIVEKQKFLYIYFNPRVTKFNTVTKLRSGSVSYNLDLAVTINLSRTIIIYQKKICDMHSFLWTKHQGQAQQALHMVVSHTNEKIGALVNNWTYLISTVKDRWYCNSPTVDLFLNLEIQRILI